jgi:predicted flap endonuclease-1-like 5' DNA nuclease
MTAFLALLLNIWGPLLLVALMGGVIGWYWHAGRMRPKQKALEDERRRLRAELLDLAVSSPREAAMVSSGDDESSRRRIAELERALAESRGRGAEVDVLRARLAELEQYAKVRPVAALDVTDYTTRIAALEKEIESAKRKISEAEELKARAASLDAPTDDADMLRWRARYFEARTTYLTQAAEAAEQDASGLRARMAALDAAPPPVEDAEKTQLVWRNRYLTERLKYLEGQGAAPTTDQEAEDRRRWRMRYLEQRVLHLEGQRPAPLPSADVEPLKAKIAELESKAADSQETANKLIEAEDDAIRATWTTRYLQSRVKYLEEHLRGAADHEVALKRVVEEATLAKDAAQKAQARAEAEARDAVARAAEAEARAARPAPPVQAQPIIAPAPQPAPRAPESAVMRMERPPTLRGARNGAPDDFTLIEGLSEQSAAALHGMGIHHFDQIAAWTEGNVAWVNQYFNLGGRIAQHRWVEQAKALSGR